MIKLKKKKNITFFECNFVHWELSTITRKKKKMTLENSYGFTLRQERIIVTLFRVSALLQSQRLSLKKHHDQHFYLRVQCHGLLEYPDVQLPFDAKHRPGRYY